MAKLTREQESDIREAFDLFDVDGSGSIDVEEMEEAMKALGVNVTKNEIKKMMDSVDEDKSGMVSYEEFKLLMCGKLSTEGDGDVEGDCKKGFGVRVRCPQPVVEA